MNVSDWGLWGFVATLVLTTVLSASQGIGLTRINMPYLLGTVFSPDRDRAKIIGFLVHLINGWLFALVYVAIFDSWGKSGWLQGAIIGLIHGSIVLFAIMPIMPGAHPRMARGPGGPTPIRQLEPPGFLALHYGPRTPLSVLVAHAIYGAILGGFYHVS